MKHARILATLLAATTSLTMAACGGNAEPLKAVSQKGSSSQASGIGSRAVQRELLNRWNAVAEPQSATSYDFRWVHFDHFPHPINQGATLASYHAFAVVLLAFLESDDNFRFLEAEALFDAPLPDVTDNHCCDVSWTFRQLVNDFSDENTFNADLETRAELQAVKTRIDQAG